MMACRSPQEETQNRIYYLKDSRTGLCFVNDIYSRGTPVIISCTPEIERLAER